MASRLQPMRRRRQDLRRRRQGVGQQRGELRRVRLAARPSQVQRGQDQAERLPLDRRGLHLLRPGAEQTRREAPRRHVQKENGRRRRPGRKGRQTRPRRSRRKSQEEEAAQGQDVPTGCIFCLKKSSWLASEIDHRSNHVRVVCLA